MKFFNWGFAFCFHLHWTNMKAKNGTAYTLYKKPDSLFMEAIKPIL